MTELAVSGQAGKLPDASNDMATSMLPLAPSAPTIEMIPNLSFSFPRRPLGVSTTGSSLATNNPTPRPMSMPAGRHPRSASTTHRRGASTLPSFTFNSADSSGLASTDNADPEGHSSTLTTIASTPLTPSRHKRFTSELVGGDSRFGMTNAISSSPTRADQEPSHPSTPPRAFEKPPTFARGHGHRRSVAVSSHDLSTIMFPAAEASSQSQNPAADHVATGPEDPFGPSPDQSPARPDTRPRVGFSDDIEFIPRPNRPLSTISSGTEGTLSTARDHSVNNSISSIMSISTPSPPAARARTTSLETTFEEPAKTPSTAALEVSPPIAKDTEVSDKALPPPVLRRPLESMRSRPRPVSYCEDSPRQTTPASHKKRLSMGRAFGLDRRRSEPLIGMLSAEESESSGLTLSQPSHDSNYSSRQESESYASGGDLRSTTKKFKDWAKSLILRKSKDVPEMGEEQPSGTSSTPAVELPIPEPIASPEPAVAETNLDAVLGMDESPVSPMHPIMAHRMEFANPIPSHHSNSSTPSFKAMSSDEQEESGTVLDLDAALGPFKTPPLGTYKQQRKELHSSRLTRDFGGPGGHYAPTVGHRRTESAPMMPSFVFARSTPPLAGMADVFEEDEDEDDNAEASRASQRPVRSQDDELNTGVQIVDEDPTASTAPRGMASEDGLRIQSSGWELQRPSSAPGTVIARLSMPPEDRRTSIIEETIVEEPSPVESLEIVDADDEPRAPSLTKSSESSETPTLLACAPLDILPLPGVGDRRSYTPDTYQTSSTVSTPDFTRRQSSFDTSRIGTSASSMTDNHTISSCATTEPVPEQNVFTSDDVPSLTSSRSTMMSVLHPTSSRRDISGSSGSFGPACDAESPVSRDGCSTRTPSIASSYATDERRRKRASIQSLSQLVSSPFSSRSGLSDTSRPQTAAGPVMLMGRSRSGGNSSIGMGEPGPSSMKKKENRLSKLLFWRKHRQASSSQASNSSSTSLTPSASMADFPRPATPLVAPVPPIPASSDT